MTRALLTHPREVLIGLALAPLGYGALWAFLALANLLEN